MEGFRRRNFEETVVLYGIDPAYIAHIPYHDALLIKKQSIEGLILKCAAKIRDLEIDADYEEYAALNREYKKRTKALSLLNQELEDIERGLKNERSRTKRVT